MRIVWTLLAAHPDGLVVGEITEALGISGSTLSHHLERLRMEGLVTVQRQGTFLRYRLDTSVLRELLGWFVSRCCGESGPVELRDIAGLVPGSSCVEGGSIGVDPPAGR